MCAKKARINIFKILEKYKTKRKIKYIGLTATPIRSDGVDVVAEFFDNVMVYSYSIVNAINDGILKRPYYVYCDYEEEFEEEVKDKIMEAALQVDKEWEDSPEYKREIFKGRILENVDKVDVSMIDIIKTYTEKYICTNYMKFIVFFRDIDHIDTRLSEVTHWFEEAFPDHEIEILRVSTKNKEERENVGERLNSLKRKNKTIHIIACIDMLNMGYHVKNISGLIMYRGTHSSLIYTQQLGRIMSAGNNKKTIIFDIVDNIHRKALFELPVAKDDEDKGLRLTDFKVNKNNEVVIYDEEGKEVKTEYHIDESGKVVNENNEETEFIYDKESGFVYEKIGPESLYSGRASNIDLTEECFDPVSDIASTRELMAKLEAELLSEKCHWVLETHLRSWCVVHGYPYPITRENSKEFYDKRYEDFYNWFANLIRERKLDYPYYDIEKLLYIGTEDDDIQTSLEICASVRNISVPLVLDILGFK
jgi:superfamily II DNA or RNA helicase